MSMDRYNTGSTLPLYAAGGGPRPSPNIGLGLRSQFQISGYMMLASFVFWICMGVAAFKAFEYGTIYMSFDDDKLEIPGCCQNFGGVFEDNYNVIEMYDKKDTGPYLMRLGPETYMSNFKGTQTPIELEQIPPIVTAVSTADFYAVQSLIKQWKEDIKATVTGAKLIIYDIGLYARELELLTTHCACEIRTFRTSAYPTHVADISTFAYRPIIMQTIIEEFGSVMWVDPNVLFTRASELNQLKYRGERNFFLWQPNEFVGTIAFTNPKTFEYLKESRCCYMESGLIDTSAMVFYRTNMTWNTIFKPWLKCALNKDCIAPARSRYSGCFQLRNPKTTGCHRYDQSVLSLIMDRMYSFSHKTEKYVIPRVTRLQEDYLEYFPEQPWKYTEMFFVTIMPFACLGGLVFIFLRRKRLSGKSNYSKR